jgi:flagellar FliL protein
MAEARRTRPDDRDSNERLPPRTTMSARPPEDEDAAAVPAADEAPPSFFTAGRIFFFFILPLFVIVGGGSAAYFTGALARFMPGHQISCENVKEGDRDYAACNVGQAAVNTTPQAFLTIPDIIVNLNSTTKQPRFLKIALKVELENIEEQRKLEPILPRVIDQFQMYLRELRVEDLRGTSGIYRLKIELLSRVRAAAPDIKIRDVLFQEILVQ